MTAIHSGSGLIWPEIFVAALRKRATGTVSLQSCPVSLQSCPCNKYRVPPVVRLR